MENPLEHFQLHPLIPLHLFGFDISINIAVIMMWLVVAGVSLFLIMGGRRRLLVPTKLQSAAEVAVDFLRQITLETIGPKGPAFLPFLATLFFFILFANLIGLIPGAYTATSQVMVTAVFALSVYLISLIVGFRYHGLHYLTIYAPPGVPGWLLPLMIPIEIVSQLARPVTLAVRLFANMTAGHTIIAVFFGLMLAGGLLIGWLPFAGAVAIYLLEVMVAFIQAYIFFMFACVYIGEAIHLH